jgi:hypothetical protein
MKGGRYEEVNQRLFNQAGFSVLPSSGPASNPANGRENVEVKYIQGTIIIAILAFFILCLAIRPIREWLFGPPDIDDSKGFPWSRKKHR